MTQNAFVFEFTVHYTLIFPASACLEIEDICVAFFLLWNAKISHCYSAFRDWIFVFLDLMLSETFPCFVKFVANTTLQRGETDVVGLYVPRNIYFVNCLFSTNPTQPYI